MRKYLCIALALAAWVACGIEARAEGGPHRIGAGVNYWVALDDVDEAFDDNGLGYVLSYQYKKDLVGLGIDAELLPDRFGEDTYAPQAYVIVGNAIYAGAGIGWLYHDGEGEGEFSDDPFYSFRAGIDLALLGPLHLDIYGQYRFEATEQLSDSQSDLDTDTVYLGAAVRMAL